MGIASIDLAVDGDELSIEERAARKREQKQREVAERLAAEEAAQEAENAKGGTIPPTDDGQQEAGASGTDNQQEAGASGTDNQHDQEDQQDATFSEENFLNVIAKGLEIVPYLSALYEIDKPRKSFLPLLEKMTLTHVDYDPKQRQKPVALNLKADSYNYLVTANKVAAADDITPEQALQMARIAMENPRMKKEGVTVKGTASDRALLAAAINLVAPGLQVNNIDDLSQQALKEAGQAIKDLSQAEWGAENREKFTADKNANPKNTEEPPIDNTAADNDSEADQSAAEESAEQTDGQAQDIDAAKEGDLLLPEHDFYEVEDEGNALPATTQDREPIDGEAAEIPEAGSHPLLGHDNAIPLPPPPPTADEILADAKMDREQYETLKRLFQENGNKHSEFLPEYLQETVDAAMKAEGIDLSEAQPIEDPVETAEAEVEEPAATAEKSHSPEHIKTSFTGAATGRNDPDYASTVAIIKDHPGGNRSVWEKIDGVPTGKRLTEILKAAAEDGIIEKQTGGWKVIARTESGEEVQQSLPLLPTPKSDNDPRPSA